MPFELRLKESIVESITLSTGTLPLAVVRHPRARRYLLRLNPDRSVRLTIPRGGSRAEALEFLHRQMSWLERAAERLSRRPELNKEWRIGTEILWGGERVPIQIAPGSPGCIQFGNERVSVRDPAGDLRPAIEAHAREVAWRELPPLVQHFADQHRFTIKRVTVRNQRSRWGSCSRSGVISLNWRILQAPASVRDYLLLHELMHLREMNHSVRFWAHVATACPEYKTADRWLHLHGYLLRH